MAQDIRLSTRDPWLIAFLRPILWVLFRIFFRIEYRGRDNVPLAGPCIIAPNHQSFLDPLFVGLGMRPAAHYMAWDRLFRVPVFGWFIRQMGAFPVDVLRPDKSSYKQSLKVLKHGDHLVVFPEGGRTRRYPLEEFKNGVVRMALATGAPMVPCTIVGGCRVWPPTRRFPRPGKIRVIYHPPIPVSVAGFEDAETERACIAELLGQLRAQVLEPLTAFDANYANSTK
jgi:1-acyl-sn-glycerol-3-phosphate acyltransferase